MLLANIKTYYQVRTVIIFFLLALTVHKGYSQDQEEFTSKAISEQMYPLLIETTKGFIGEGDIVTVQYYVITPELNRTISSDTGSTFAISRIIMEGRRVFSTIPIGTISLPHVMEEYPLVVPVVIEHNRLYKLTAEQRKLLVSVASDRSFLGKYFQTWCAPLGITSSYHAD